MLHGVHKHYVRTPLSLMFIKLDTYSTLNVRSFYTMYNIVRKAHAMRLRTSCLRVSHNSIKPRPGSETKKKFWEEILGYWNYVLPRNTHAMHFV